MPEGSRWCPRCKQAVPVEDHVQSACTPSGFGSRCKACHNEANSTAHWLRTHGISEVDVAQMRASQGDRCAICGDQEPRHLDHDHGSGVTRQLLCQRCNHGLGSSRDDPALLHTAAFHIRGHREVQALRRLQETFVVRPGGTDG
ncbi:endonuclease domain-containing protein [Geodermatophilus sp. SYSU D00697]